MNEVRGERLFKDRYHFVSCCVGCHERSIGISNGSQTTSEGGRGGGILCGSFFHFFSLKYSRARPPFMEEFFVLLF